MKLVSLDQGSAAWLEFRASHFTASEAPAMAGISPYVTRAELLQQKYSGHAPDVSPDLQRVFDKGHESEAAMRPVIEKMLGEDLFPCTVTDDHDYLSASLDGMTMDNTVIWEHKQDNFEKRQLVDAGEVPETDRIQIQQQLLVTGAERCLYTVGNSADDYSHIWVEPDGGTFVTIQKGWAQFARDLKDFSPPDRSPEPVGASMDALPALRVEVQGMVTASNLDAFKLHALQVFDGISTELSTDQDFADAEATVKWCKGVEDKLEAAKDAALSQTESIEVLFRTLDDLKSEARTKRLALNKLVTARKSEVRTEIRQQAEQRLAEHVNNLDARFDGRALVPPPPADFAGAMKNKRTIASLQDAVDQVLANAKIDANAAADEMQANLKTYDQLAEGYDTLFPDLSRLAMKPKDDFEAAVKLRISEHKQAEAKRIADEEAKQRAAEEASQQKAEQEESPVPTAAPPVGAPAAPAPEPMPEPEQGAPSELWKLEAVFEIELTAGMSAQQVEDRLRARLAGFGSLTSVRAELAERKAA